MLELDNRTCFDANKFVGDINVRAARDGEKFLALDGKLTGSSPTIRRCRSRARGWDRRRWAARNRWHHPRTAFAPKGPLFAGEHSTNCTQLEFADRRELPLERVSILKILRASQRAN
jgi:hypothetical protein